MRTEKLEICRDCFPDHQKTALNNAEAFVADEIGSEIGVGGVLIATIPLLPCQAGTF